MNEPKKFWLTSEFWLLPFLLIATLVFQLLGLEHLAQASGGGFIATALGYPISRGLSKTKLLPYDRYDDGSES